MSSLESVRYLLRLSKSSVLEVCLVCTGGGGFVFCVFFSTGCVLGTLDLGAWNSINYQY